MKIAALALLLALAPPAAAEPAAKTEATPTAEASAPAAGLFIGTYPVVGASDALDDRTVRMLARFEGVGDIMAKSALVQRRRAKRRQEGVWAIDSFSYPATRERPQPQHLRPSFLLDYDQPAVQALVTQARSRFGDRPSPAQLTTFVGETLAETMERGFDVASAVAHNRAGDCTEHAVLLASLLRAFRTPARVLIGLVVVRANGLTQAFGHAWTELHQDGRWQPADAALLGLPTTPVYLPLLVIKREDAGFGREVLNMGGLLNLQRLELEPR